MIILTLAELTYEKLLKKCEEASHLKAVIEVRLDALNDLNFKQISLLNQKYQPLFTLRSYEEKGFKSFTSKEREKKLKELIDLKPKYLDLEYERDLDLLPYLEKNSPKTKWICSYHPYDNFPQSLDELILEMKKAKPWKVKIAVNSRGGKEALLMLRAMKRHKDFIGIAMGERGRISRILAPCFDQPITYAALLKSSTLQTGQLTYEELENLYHYSDLNTDTKLLGIIGQPLGQSPGYRVYNSIFIERKVNAIYVNIELNPDELKESVALFKELGFHGLSVTIPHKETIVPFVDEVETTQKGIGAINSLSFSKGKIKGKNTDGIGALKCVEAYTPVKNKKVLILGAGGTACGLGFVFKSAGGQITFMNRSNEKAERLAKSLDASYRPFEELSELKTEDYDVLVHATSVGNSNPEDCILPEKCIFSDKVFIDVVFQKTRLLKIAAQKGSQTINGFEFYISQAKEQFEYWFNSLVPNVQGLMKKYMEKILKK